MTPGGLSLMWSLPVFYGLLLGHDTELRDKLLGERGDISTVLDYPRKDLLVGLEGKAMFFLCTWVVPLFMCGTLTAHSQKLVCFSLVNSNDLILTVPWTLLHQKNLHVLDRLWLAFVCPQIFAEQPQIQDLDWVWIYIIWWIPLTPIWWFTDNRFYATGVLLEALPMTNRQLVGKGKFQGVLGYLMSCLSTPRWWKQTW